MKIDPGEKYVLLPITWDESSELYDLLYENNHDRQYSELLERILDARQETRSLLERIGKSF